MKESRRRSYFAAATDPCLGSVVIGILVLVSLMHGAGLPVALLFLAWLGINKLRVLRKKRLPE